MLIQTQGVYTICESDIKRLREWSVFDSHSFTFVHKHTYTHTYAYKHKHTPNIKYNIMTLWIFQSPDINTSGVDDDDDDGDVNRGNLMRTPQLTRVVYKLIISNNCLTRRTLTIGRFNLHRSTGWPLWRFDFPALIYVLIPSWKSYQSSQLLHALDW